MVEKRKGKILNGVVGGRVEGATMGVVGNLKMGDVCTTFERTCVTPPNWGNIMQSQNGRLEL